GHVRQGDALVDPLTLARALSGATAPAVPSAEVERLTLARRALFSLVGPAKRRALGELARAEGALARRLFAAAAAALGRRAAARVGETRARRYTTGRPAGERGFAHLPDLAVAFVERALELTAPGGTVALLVPAKLASSGYAAPLRQRLAASTRLERVAPIPAASGAFGAAVYPMAPVAARLVAGGTPRAPLVDPRDRRATPQSPPGGAGTRTRPASRASEAPQRLPRRSRLAAVPSRAGQCPAPCDLAGPRPAAGGGRARRGDRPFEHAVRHRDALARRRACAR